MLLQIRRPRRPEPLPLRERKPADAAGRDASVWINVRQKRDRALSRSAGRTNSLTSRGQKSAPQK